MKLITFCALLVLPAGIFAQDCKLKKSIDPYTKETRLSTGFIKLDGAILSIEADSKEIDFVFTMNATEKCFSDAANATVIYEGIKMKANYKNAGPVNCEGVFHIIFKNGVSTPTLLQRLVTQKITSIGFTGNDKSVTTITFQPEDQQKFMVLGDCLIKQAKTLLPNP
jgi:hypothetical protein